MIFSKDKKPTEAGWYWFITPLNREPKVIQFVRDQLGVLRVAVNGTPWHFKPEDLNLLYGDKIPVPTVETDDQQERGE